MKKTISKIWNAGYLSNYVPLFPSDQWWNLWSLPILALAVYASSFLPDRIFNNDTIQVIGWIMMIIGGIIIGFFAYLIGSTVLDRSNKKK